ncbi:hypothetical protein FKX85_16860 [Echinicola soli]|uniref:Alpha/beta hydrolase n=1 Tax=Echinicola soli TaxID=2591634 RepID=A0A514CLF1_9BACT|nr:hypothetical protein [Echinicola soli]QDH80620.1 hypothetical protein FKX85_16860 [Echinicola soli]
MLKFFPSSFFTPPRSLAHRLFGTDKKELLNSILDLTDTLFTKWAVIQLVKWKNRKRIENLIKISGTKDKLNPASNIDKNTYLIVNGEHFMIVDKADEISQLINQQLPLLFTDQ